MEDRIVPAFTAITLNGVGSVRVSKGPQAVSVTIDADLADLFETGVRDGRLVMGFKSGLRTMLALPRLSTCAIEVTMPSLDGVELNGAGTLAFEGFAGGALAVTTNGAARVSGTVSHDVVTVRMSGAGRAELEGEATALDVGCTGGGELDSGSLAAGSARVSMTGAARVELRVRKELRASITGAGRLAYWGSPIVIESVSGSGSVLRLGD